MADALVNLADAIDGLRAELTQAINSGAEGGMHFRLDRIELTVQAVVKNAGHGKIGWKIVEAGGVRESVTTQSLKLVLEPVWKMQSGAVIADPLISGMLPAPVPSQSSDDELPPPDPDND